LLLLGVEPASITTLDDHLQVGRHLLLWPFLLHMSNQQAFSFIANSNY
jgi:hypothetical protein